MIKTVIADDDPNVRTVLERALSTLPAVEIVGEAETGLQLVHLVETLNPDVVFIDVDMPEINGIEASKEIFDINPRTFIIFATAFDNYTHEAFEVYAFDYILKPFRVDRIIKTMKQVEELIPLRKGVKPETVSKTNGIDINRKFVIHSPEKTVVVNLQDIILVTRVERKTEIYSTRGVFYSYEPLRKIQSRLDEKTFFRCHKGFIVNTDYILEIFPWGNKTYLVKLANIKETALMTLDKAKEFYQTYCLG